MYYNVNVECSLEESGVVIYSRSQHKAAKKLERYSKRVDCFKTLKLRFQLLDLFNTHNILPDLSTLAEVHFSLPTTAIAYIAFFPVYDTQE